MNYAVMAAVAVGGAIGSVARYLMAGLVPVGGLGGFSLRDFRGQYQWRLHHGPAGELMALKWNVSLEMRAFLTTGIMGGYTTFSTFSLDSALLIQRGSYASAALISWVRRCFRSWHCLPGSGRFGRSMPELRTIAEEDDGIRLDRWFRRHYPALTHARLEKLLRKGEVRLDGKRAKSADRVAGQSLRLPPQVIHDRVEERPKPAPVQTSRKLEDTILYMDKHLFV